MPVVTVYTTAAQFHHALAHMAQACQVELGIGVRAAHAACLSRGEDAVGADHLSRARASDYQVFTKVIEQIHIVPWQGAAENGTHLFGKHSMAKALCFPYFIEMTGPTDFDTTA
jgi:hypothetical protein